MATAVESDQDDIETEDHDGLGELVRKAQAGDPGAWQELIKRFTPLVVSVTRSFRLTREDAQDVGQVVWMKLCENIGQLREPRALPGWLRTTIRHEALRQLKSAGRTHSMDPMTLASFELPTGGPDVDNDLLRAERDRAVNNGLTEIEPQHRNLLILLHADDRPSYQTIGKILGMPTGSIGPTRARGLQKLRSTRSMSSFFQSDAGSELFATG